MKERAYHEQVNIDNEVKLRELIKELPPFCREYFIGITPSTSSRTRIAYAYDLGVFFHFMQENNPALAKMEVTEFPLEILDQITPTDIEEYLQYLKYYVGSDGAEHTNDERGQMRKLSTLRSMYNYFFRKEMIEKNPASLVQMPKRHEKEIVRLDVDEIAILLDEAESGEKLTDRQKIYHEKTKTRDMAILTLLLGTGIRVSECVGLDINDIDAKNNGIKIHRKGGKEMVVYFGDEVAEALDAYLDERLTMEPVEDTQALFLSLQNRRISVRSVENLVKKYSQLVTTVKNITPHKLRSTYGTNLYRETGDIYLVADVLGHSDVNTTRRHYAAQEDARRRMAAKAVTLREKHTDSEKPEHSDDLPED